jgi:hypothetical protein
MKGIVGTDERKYILDLLRLTPRDANFVPLDRGGTGKWESAAASAASSGAAAADTASTASDSTATPPLPAVPNDHAALLRPELVQRWRRRLGELKQWKKATTAGGGGSSTVLGPLPGEEGLAEEGNGFDEPLNANVFMPFCASVNKEEAVADEVRARKVAAWMWDCVLPALTAEVRRGTILPLDGGVLVEILHSFGINVRYMGRLAHLALLEERKDQRSARMRLKAASPSSFSATQDGGVEEDAESSDLPPAGSALFPLFWRRLLEVEMVSRASKHVLRRLLDQLGPQSRQSPGPILTQFLNALFGSGPRHPSVAAAAGEAATASSGEGAGVGSAAEGTEVGSNEGTKKKKKKKGGKNSASSTPVVSPEAARSASAANSPPPLSLSSSSPSGSDTGNASSNGGGDDGGGLLSASYLESLSQEVLATPTGLPLEFGAVEAWTLIAEEVPRQMKKI